MYITGHTSNVSVTCLQFCRELSSKNRLVGELSCSHHTAPGGHFDLGTFPLSSYTTAVQTVLIVNLVFGSALWIHGTVVPLNKKRENTEERKKAPVSNFRNRCVGQMSFEITGLPLLVYTF